MLIFVFFFQAKSEEQVATEKQWLDAEKIWLMHRGGFAAARKDTTAKSEPGKLTIRLDQTGDILTVDEDDVEKVGSNVDISNFLKVGKCHFSACGKKSIS